MTRRAFIGACVVLLLPVDGNAAERVRVHDVVRHYEVRGATVQEIAASIRANGPTAPSGRRVAGNTTTAIEWDVEFEASPGRCRIVDTDVRLDVTTLLPRWQPPPAVSVDLRRRWATFLTRLRAHEDRHRGIGLQAAHQLADALAALDGERGCAESRRRVEALGQAAVREAAGRNRRYDSESRHGLEEGVDLGR